MGVRVRPDAAYRLIACAPVMRHLSLNLLGLIHPHQWPPALPAFRQLESITLELMGVKTNSDGKDESATFHQAFANLHSCHAFTLPHIIRTSALLP